MGNMFKSFNLLHINLLGIGISLVAALFLFFLMIKPKQDDIKSMQADTASVQSNGGTQQAVDEKKNGLKQEEAKGVKAQADWVRSSSYYMPDLKLNGPDVLSTYETRLIRLPAYFGQYVTSWYAKQSKYGVTLDPGVSFPVPAFPPDPNAVSTVDHLTVPGDGRNWSVGVNAQNFDAGMAHLRRINSMEGHGMPVIDNVALSGQSPNLQMTYSLALYVIPPKGPAAADPRIGGAAGAGAGGAGGMGGFGGGGFPGGRPGMGGFGPPTGMPGVSGPPGGFPGGMGGKRMPAIQGAGGSGSTAGAG
ncbi:MAG TPA: hypothetical protein VKT32_14960 [Chthonomonadaceae bacterium]|nr:hypothetical protein [Chthonomonadaceae bacterium]